MKLSKLFSLRKNQESDEEYYNKVTYKVFNNQTLDKHAKVTVVVPVYNAEEYLKKTVDSVILQNIGFENITVVIVDDGSNDSSRDILKEYAELYSNIVVIFLEENTGTPAFPRNLGAYLANSSYITFLDADDWLAPNGIKVLFELMEKTNCNYAVGKTIQIGSKNKKIVGRYESAKERENVSPFSIKHLFYHLGPRARMMKLDLIRENKIRYPEMKFAEDKQFFIDVITAAGSISTTTTPIYYLNRIDGNDSLTKQTDIMEKMDSNIKVLKHVLDKKLNPDEEKVIVNRIIEFDSITRLFDRKHFVKSDNKKAYYDKFEEVMGIFNQYNRPYSIEDTIIKPINKKYFQLLMEKDFKNVEDLAVWSKQGGTESKVEIDGLPYTLAHLENGGEIAIEIPFTASIQNEYMSEETLKLEIELKGHKIPEVQSLQFQSRSSILDSHIVTDIEQKASTNILSIDIKKENLEDISKDGYVMYLTYNDYERITINKDSETEYKFKIDGSLYKFYKTIKGNISLKVSEL